MALLNISFPPSEQYNIYPLPRPIIIHYPYYPYYLNIVDDGAIVLILTYMDIYGGESNNLRILRKAPMDVWIILSRHD